MFFELLLYCFGNNIVNFKNSLAFLIISMTESNNTSQHSSPFREICNRAPEKLAMEINDKGIKDTKVKKGKDLQEKLDDE